MIEGVEIRSVGRVMGSAGSFRHPTDHPCQHLVMADHGEGGDAAGVASPPPETATTIDLSTASVVIALAALTTVSVLVVVVSRASVPTTLVVLSLFLALGLDPLVTAVQRHLHLRRGWAVALVLGVGGALAMAFMAVAAPELAAQSKAVGHELPATIDSLADLPLVGGWLRDHDVPAHVRDAVGSIPEELAGRTSDLGHVTGALAFGAGTAILGVLLVAGALLDGPSLVDLVRRAVPPGDRPTADQLGGLVYDVLARYFAGNLLLALLHGAWVALTGILVGVPLSPVLGVWTAVTSLIPQVGGFLGFVVVAAVSLTQGLGAAVVMSALFFAYMTFDNNVLLPVVVGRAVDVPPAVTMVAAIAGFSVAGVVGSLLAVPTVAAVKGVASFVRHRDDPGYVRPGYGPVLDIRTLVGRVRHRSAAPDHPPDRQPDSPPDRAG